MRNEWDKKINIARRISEITLLKILTMNWPVAIIVGIVAIVLIAFLVWRNVKDEKQFENQLKEDYPKSKDEEGDAEIDQTMK